MGRLDRALSDCNVASRDVELIELPFPRHAGGAGQRFARCREILEPFAHHGLNAGLYTLWKRTDEFYPGWQIAVLLYASQFIANQREVGHRFMVAYLKGLRDSLGRLHQRSNKAEVIDVLVRHSTVKDPALFENMARRGGPRWLHQHAQVLRRRGMVDEHGYVRARVDPTQVVDNSFVDYAIDRLGRYQPQ